MNNLNYTMLCDFYELTMGSGYFVSGMKDKITYFDLFFRQIPDNGGFAIACGLEQVIEYIEDLHFSDEDIDRLRQIKEQTGGKDSLWNNAICKSSKCNIHEK